MTHTELVKRALTWLRKPAHALPTSAYFYKPGCGVVLPEYVAYTGEIVDALGFTGGGTSYSIECKVSRADYARDAKKARRLGLPCIGEYLLYMMPEGLVAPSEVPDGYGLVLVSGRRTVFARPPRVNPLRSFEAEIGIAYSLMRRATVHGHLTSYLSPKWGGARPPR